MPITHQGNSQAPEFIMEQLKDLRGIKSSDFAKKAQDELLEKGVIPKLENHEWARLCIAYHFSVEPNMAAFTTPAPDAGGREIPSLSTCFQAEWRFWLALIVDNMPNANNPNSQIEIGQVAKRINDHWHQGATLLKDRYDKLSVAFPNRYDSRMHWLNELAKITKDNGASYAAISNLDGLSSEGENQTHRLQSVLEKIGLRVEVPEPLAGVRYDRYTLRMRSFADVNSLEKNLDNLTSELGVPKDNIRLVRCEDGRANSLYLNYLRPESTWKQLDDKLFSEALRSKPSNMILPVCVGTDEMGTPAYEDLTKAPHVFIGGATNTGKSVCVHGMIKSLLHQKTGDCLQVALFDPKRVELSAYRNHPNLWQEHIFIDDIADGIDELVVEMESRYRFMEAQNVNLISNLPEAIRPPYIAVVVDELADLVMSNNGKVIEDNLVKLAQKARACGIHLIMATQRPDSQTFRGLLRSNMPARIALKVQKSTESKIILDETGAEDLAGKGDRLVKWGGETMLRHGYRLD
jgi:S-DNA-T family DNA segregation ATPase FtsK/SpoIIIE